MGTVTSYTHSARQRNGIAWCERTVRRQLQSDNDPLRNVLTTIGTL